MYLFYLQMVLKHDLYNIDDSQKLKQASYCLTEPTWLAVMGSTCFQVHGYLEIIVTDSLIYILYIRFMQLNSLNS